MTLPDRRELSSGIWGRTMKENQYRLFRRHGGLRNAWYAMDNRGVQRIILFDTYTYEVGDILEINELCPFVEIPGDQCIVKKIENYP